MLEKYTVTRENDNKTFDKIIDIEVDKIECNDFNDIVKTLIDNKMINNRFKLIDSETTYTTYLIFEFGTTEIYLKLIPIE